MEDFKKDLLSILGDTWHNYESLFDDKENEINNAHVVGNGFPYFNFDSFRQQVYHKALEFENDETNLECVKNCLDNYSYWLEYIINDGLLPDNEKSEELILAWESMGLELIKVYDLVLQNSIGIVEKTSDFIIAAVNNYITLAGYTAIAVGGYGFYHSINNLVNEGVLTFCILPLSIALFASGVIDLAITQFPGSAYHVLRSAKNCHSMYGELHPSVTLLAENGPCEALGLRAAKKILKIYN